MTYTEHEVLNVRSNAYNGGYTKGLVHGLFYGIGGSLVLFIIWLACFI